MTHPLTHLCLIQRQQGKQPIINVSCVGAEHGLNQGHDEEETMSVCSGSALALHFSLFVLFLYPVFQFAHLLQRWWEL